MTKKKMKLHLSKLPPFPPDDGDTHLPPVDFPDDDDDGWLGPYGE